MVLFVVAASREMFSFLGNYTQGMLVFVLPCVIALAGIWLAYRFIQYPPIADFLIEVQHESLKVTWCTWPELQRTTSIVLITMVVISVYLFACDFSWQSLLRMLSVLNI